MAPFKSSLARSGKKLLGLFNQRDLSLRGATQDSKFVIPPGQATGGTVVGPYGGKTIHMFTSSGTFTANGSKTCEYVIVAGGAAGSSSGGGGTAGGGGGAGGYLTGTGLVLDGAYRVEVGDGGTCPGGGSGSPGNPSYIGPGPSWTGSVLPNNPTKGTHAIGGGRGGDYEPNTTADNGGSGGGGDYNSKPAGYGFNPTTPAPIRSGEPRYRDGDTQGMPGGDGTNNPEQIGGGGGGRGGAGTGGNGSTYAGGAGVRIPSTFHTPNVNIGAPGPAGLWYCCGGGGGARYSPADGGPGGYGGGGNGRNGGDGYSATANSGGGGGGVARADSNNGGSGGSGFVLIAYDEIN